MTIGKNRWRKDHSRELEKTRFSFPPKTTSEIEIAELYSPDVVPDKVGFPGEFPFTRGIHSTMYRGRLWTMRQYSGFGTAAETNKRYRYLLEQGTTGLSVAFDLPTQMGLDSDNQRAVGEVGRVGVAIDSIEDMELLFSGIPLDTVSTSMTINSTAHILLALYLVLAKKQNVSWDKVSGTVQNDILKEYIARGTYIYPPHPAMKIVVDIMEFCKDQVPGWNTISISGYHIREAGSTAVQEIAFTLADGIAYVDAAVKRGLDVDSFAPRIAFFFNCHNNFLEEVAKFRAARRLWARIMKERFGAKSPRSMMVRFHTQTAGSSLTAQQPLNNVVRTTLQALAAVMGGTQSLHTNSYDEALGLPTDSSVLLALRTQQIIASESGAADFVDPFGGSYVVEELTDQLESRAVEYLEEIDRLGGMVSAIEQRFPQREIESAAYAYQRSIESRQQEIIGVNVHKDQSADEIPTYKVDPRFEKDQRKRLKAFKERRDPEAINAKLAAVRNTAVEGRNLMPSVIEAVENSVTLGEISSVLRDIYGEYSGS